MATEFKLVIGKISSLVYTINRAKAHIFVRCHPNSNN